MRVFAGVFFGVVLSFSLSLAAVAADLKVNVLDPQGVAVAGAQVSLTRPKDGQVVAAQATSAEGAAAFQAVSGPYQVRVLAPGFAAETVDISSQAEITVNLRLATGAETVVVTATRTPVVG